MKFNDNLKHIKIGRDEDVPIEGNSILWFLWVYDNGNWDAERITRMENILNEIQKPEVKTIFCNWHGQWKTDLFLMNKKKLIKRFKKILK
jgi:hypothetical protein